MLNPNSKFKYNCWIKIPNAMFSPALYNKLIHQISCILYLLLFVCSCERYIFRRDKEFCHECRFCCTLSVCTTPDGTFYRQSDNLTVNIDPKQRVSAAMGFMTDWKMWKGSDYRCLKPREESEPEDWPHFEMKGYRAAKNTEELEIVQEIKFDKYFFNFEDPKIFNEMIKENKRENIWKTTYGFDFVSFNDRDRNNSHLPFSKCYIKCFIAEYQVFATECRKKGGLFKCCMTALV